jgi:hypothetical protein
MKDPNDRINPLRGSIDESERKFSPEELRIAEELQSEGKEVKALSEGKDSGRLGGFSDG